MTGSKNCATRARIRMGRVGTRGPVRKSDTDRSLPDACRRGKPIAISGTGTGGAKRAESQPRRPTRWRPSAWAAGMPMTRATVAATGPIRNSASGSVAGVPRPQPGMRGGGAWRGRAPPMRRPSSTGDRRHIPKIAFRRSIRSSFAASWTMPIRLDLPVRSTTSTPAPSRILSVSSRPAVLPVSKTRPPAASGNGVPAGVCPMARHRRARPHPVARHGPRLSGRPAAAPACTRDGGRRPGLRHR